jgi:replicative DNA helicase
MSHIRSECRARKRKSGLNVVVVDYLQLVKGDAKAPREQQIAGISRGLKQLSRELEVAVVVPTQLNRKSSEREKASMSDLRESGSIEQDADVVMMLARQYSDDGDMKGVPNGLVSVDIPKNRHGQEASFELPFRGHYSRIG